MSQSLYYDRPRVVYPGEAITFGFDCSVDLPSAETLASISTAIASDPVSADVSVGTATVNTAQFLRDDGKAVAIGKGVQVTITIASDASDADFELAGIADTSAGDSVAVRGALHVRG